MYQIAIYIKNAESQRPSLFNKIISRIVILFSNTAMQILFIYQRVNIVVS